MEECNPKDCPSRMDSNERVNVESIDPFHVPDLQGGDYITDGTTDTAVTAACNAV